MFSTKQRKIIRVDVITHRISLRHRRCVQSRFVNIGNKNWIFDVAALYCSCLMIHRTTEYYMEYG